MLPSILVAAALVAATRTPAVEIPVVTPPTVAENSAVSELPPGTPVRLMVVREINGRTAKIGERFKLRVDEPISLNGSPFVPVGTSAWGEIAMVEQNGAVGKGGRLSLKLLYLDLPSGRVPLRGGMADHGDGNGAGVVMAVVGFGILGLLTGGDSARLKARDTFTGYVDVPSGQPAAPAQPK